MIRALAIHVCADAETTGLRRPWPPVIAARDTLQRAQRICERSGVVDQRTLAGDQATPEALRDALDHAAAVLINGGLLVVTFSGHTERGDGPIETARWCLVGGGMMLSQIADHLARLPATARVILICDSCYAAAIGCVLSGPQQVIVLASCGEDQTMIDRIRSEFVVRIEEFVSAYRAEGSLAPLRDALEADTPDCERPVVWTNGEDCWPRSIS